MHMNVYLHNFKDLLRSLCKYGLPANNVFEFAALTMLKFEKKWRIKKRKELQDRIRLREEEKEKKKKEERIKKEEEAEKEKESEKEKEAERERKAKEVAVRLMNNSRKNWRS